MTVALIDADILVYEASYRAQSAIEWKPNEWTQTADFRVGQAIFTEAILKIEEAVEATSAILALTHSDRDANFRRKVWPEYKNHRERPGDDRPLLYAPLRDWVRKTYYVIEQKGIEGDDSLGIRATLKGDDYEPTVICSIDKDMLTIPGKHYNWRKHDQGVTEVTEHYAFYMLMMQTLCGDRTDGYPGLPGCGPKTAGKLLDPLMKKGSWGMWRAVVDSYEKKGLTEEDALAQARCARILHACDWDFDLDEPILWTPPGENE